MNTGEIELNEQVFSIWEGWIRKGEGMKVRRILNDLNLQKIPRGKIALKIANFAHRLNVPNLAVRLLAPYVRSRNRLLAPATVEECAEYCVGLLRVGAHLEATKLLESLDPKEFSRVWLYRGYCHMTRWEYSEAADCLRKFVAGRDEHDYERLTALVNLGASLVALNQYEEALELLQRQIGITNKLGLKLLEGNLHELLGQIYLFRSEFGLAQDAFEQSARCLGDTKSIGRFFVRKWKAILAIKEHPSEINKKGLEIIRAEAREAAHWETVRDCDLFTFEMSQDRDLFEYLYFGTPYVGYRQRLLKVSKSGLILPENYLWIPGQVGGRSGGCFDLALGETSDREVAMKPGQLNYRLLSALSLDFYRTLGIGHLFGLLFPREFYNPVTSPDKVHKAIARFRKWCNVNKIPLMIKESGGQYCLDSMNDFGIRVLDHDCRTLSRAEIIAKKLRQIWPSELFSTQQACEVLDISPSTWLRVTAELLKRKNIVRVGPPARVRYSFSRELESSISKRVSVGE